MANIKASTLKNRKADSENALDKVNAKILSGNMTVEIEYMIQNGSRVRVPSKDIPVTRDDCVALLNRNRAVTDEEILEQVGKNVMKWMLTKGIIRQASKTVFYVTKEAQKYYDLAKPAIGNYYN